MFLKIVCAWCGRFLGVKEAVGPQRPQLSITHTICCQCKRKLEEETEMILHQQKPFFHEKGE